MASKPPASRSPAPRARRPQKSAPPATAEARTLPRPGRLPEGAPAQPAKHDTPPSASAKASRPGAPLRRGVAIVGSLNMDLVVRTEIIPTPGQTVLGQDLMENPGGKGANQAAAVGRLWRAHGAAPPGARIVGKIGPDAFGQRVLADLQAAKVDTSALLVSRRAPTGAAMIFVDRHGENAIVVASGANRELTATDLLSQRKAIEQSAVLLVQLEIPADTVACAIALARRSGVLTILDPAPVSPDGLPESLYHVDILTPNQSEATLLSGVAVRTPDDARRAAERFILRGTRTVIVKLGSQGAVIVQREGAGGPAGGAGFMEAAAWGTVSGGAARTSMLHVPAFRAQAIDTTAAGDAFAGALAVALAEGRLLADAVRFANAAGALACAKAGAMAAMPTRAEVEKLLATAPPVVIPR